MNNKHKKTEEIIKFRKIIDAFQTLEKVLGCNVVVGKSELGESYKTIFKHNGKPIYIYKDFDKSIACRNEVSSVNVLEDNMIKYEIEYCLGRPYKIDRSEEIYLIVPTCNNFDKAIEIFDEFIELERIKDEDRNKIINKFFQDE